MKIIFLFVDFFPPIFAENMTGQGNPEDKLCFIVYITESEGTLTKAVPQDAAVMGLMNVTNITSLKVRESCPFT